MCRVSRLPLLLRRRRGPHRPTVRLGTRRRRRAPRTWEAALTSPRRRSKQHNLRNRSTSESYRPWRSTPSTPFSVVCRLRTCRATTPRPVRRSQARRASRCSQINKVQEHADWYMMGPHLPVDRYDGAGALGAVRTSGVTPFDLSSPALSGPRRLRRASSRRRRRRHRLGGRSQRLRLRRLRRPASPTDFLRPRRLSARTSTTSGPRRGRRHLPPGALSAPHRLALHAPLRSPAL